MVTSQPVVFEPKRVSLDEITVQESKIIINNKRKTHTPFVHTCLPHPALDVAELTGLGSNMRMMRQGSRHNYAHG